MKKHRMLVAFAALLVAFSAAGARADQAAFSTTARALPNLIAHWGFEGNYETQDSKNNAAVAGDASKVKFCEGVKGGQAIEFLNTDQSAGQGGWVAVKAPIGSAFDSPNLSVFAWAKINSEPSADHWDNIIDRTSLWYVETQWKELDDGSFGIDSVNRIYDPVEIQTAGSGQVRSSANSIYTKKGEWHLYGFTYDGKVMISFIDGKEVSRADYDGGVGPTADTPKTNDRHGHYDINFGVFTQKEDHAMACIDDTVIYGRALTADEAKSLFDSMMK